MNQLLFSVKLSDCRVDTFRSGGKGGQNQNKVESGVRIVHEASGAVGEARDSRDQKLNKRAAFRRMVDTETFQRWARVRAAAVMGKPSAEELVEAAMQQHLIRTDVRDAQGRWVERQRWEPSERC